MKLPFAHIETPRLELRPPEMGDWEAFDAFAQTERAHFVGGGADAIRRTTWRAFGHVSGHWVLRDFGPFIISLKGTGQPLGLAGPWYPMDHPEHELSWAIWVAAFEGKGIAHEAALAARHHAYATLGWKTAVSYIDPDNARSIALAERLGCVLDPDASPLDEGDLVYRHPVPDADGNPEAYA